MVYPKPTSYDFWSGSILFAFTQIRLLQVHIVCFHENKNQIVPDLKVPFNICIKHKKQTAFSGHKMGFKARKPVIGVLRTTKVQTSLCIHTVWLAPLLFPYWKVSYLNLLQASLCSWGDWFECHFVGNPRRPVLSHQDPNSGRIKKYLCLG